MMAKVRRRLTCSEMEATDIAAFSPTLPLAHFAAMPELPDITVYVERLQDLAGCQRLIQARMLNPFVWRTAVPPISTVERASALTRLNAWASASCWASATACCW